VPLTPNAASEIFKQACSALDEAHKQNIIHRDIATGEVKEGFNMLLGTDSS
jgi:serine/threonine protein kinase